MINPNLASRPGSSVSWIGDGNALNDGKDRVSNIEIRCTIHLLELTLLGVGTGVDPTS